MLPKNSAVAWTPRVINFPRGGHGAAEVEFMIDGVFSLAALVIGRRFYRSSLQVGMPLQACDPTSNS